MTIQFPCPVLVVLHVCLHQASRKREMEKNDARIEASAWESDRIEYGVEAADRRALQRKAIRFHPSVVKRSP